MANHIFASLLVAFCLISFGESKLSKTSALRQSIFADYDHLVKPDEQVTVKLGISILNLEICPHKQVHFFSFLQNLTFISRSKGKET
jgi:hypothetical protein